MGLQLEGIVNGERMTVIRKLQQRWTRRRFRTAEKSWAIFFLRSFKIVAPAFCSSASSRHFSKESASPAFSGAQGAATGTMATFARPVASAIAGINFDVYSDEDIKAISVKRIHNTPTLDSFNNPVPGGLYDPAMGALLDHACVFRPPLSSPAAFVQETREITANNIQLHDMSFEYLVLYWSPRTHRTSGTCV